MIILQNPVPISLIKNSYASFYNTMVKIVLDLEQRLLALDAEMHADLEQMLLENGSKQENLWGANLFFEDNGGFRIEFTSLINIRPAQNNKSMEVQDKKIREQIEKIVETFVLKE